MRGKTQHVHQDRELKLGLTDLSGHLAILSVETGTKLVSVDTHTHSFVVSVRGSFSHIA